MTRIIPLTRRVDSDTGASITILPRAGAADIEVGTDISYTRISFTDPNALRAIAGHLLAVADDMPSLAQRKAAAQ